MPKTLLLAAESSTIDTYVNVICHAYHVLGIRNIRLLHVPTSKISSIQAQELARRILAQLKSLSSGVHLTFPPTLDATPEPSTLTQRAIKQEHALELYGRIASDIEVEVESLQVQRLWRGIRGAVEKFGGATNCIADITATTKELAMELFASFLSIGMTEIYTFTLRVPAGSRGPERSLYFALVNGTFEYNRISGLEGVRDARHYMDRRNYGPVGVSLM